MAQALNIAPTRMELIKLRKRVALAQRGHDLLKEKMDALVMEFFTILSRIEEQRAVAMKLLGDAHKALTICLARMGTPETVEAARESRKDAKVEVSTRFIMGIKVPSLVPAVGRKVVEREYSIHLTSAALDRAAKRFEEALKSLAKLAELEAAAYAIAGELEKTKRRVNALEYIVLPGLKQMMKFIVMRLDEMERENFSRLKRIKAMLEERR
ncbi:MAG: V-type ATP synthase subunit D [Candidatus Hadarchaeales archaeon]